MKILFIGAGFVGACSAAVAADSGHEVLAYDIDAKKIDCLSSQDRDQIQGCIHEEGLGEMIIRNQERLSFSAQLKKAGEFAQEAGAIFMCLPTPEKANGESDLSFYESAVKDISPFLTQRQSGAQTQRVVIVNKSTVPVAMIDYTRQLFEQAGVKNFGIVSNPEFLVEGKAIENSVHPDRVVVGAENAEDFAIMRQVYQRFVDSTSVKYIETNPYEAAAGKLLSNFLLFSRVAWCFDVVGRICEKIPNLNFEKVREIVTSEPRIGTWGFYDSLYAGGSCFIKDAGSLAHQLEQVGARATLVREILAVNEFQLQNFLMRAKTEVNFNFADKKIAVLGLAFKQGTNDIRHSGAIAAIDWLLSQGVAEVHTYDPAAMAEAKSYFHKESRVKFGQDVDDALAGTAACLLATDWPQFKNVAENIIKIVQPPYLIMDGRRLISAHYEDLQKRGYTILPVGGQLLAK